jgi:hypothetical protein
MAAKIRRALSLAAVTLLAIGLGRTSMVSAGDAFAPKVEIPADARDHDRGLVENSVVPSRSAVGVPAYPGSRVLRTTRGMREGGDGEPEIEILPSVTLLAEADPETVAAWYAENLEGWKRESQMGMTFFHPEDVDLDLVHIGSHRLIAIGPVPQNMPAARLWPAAKSEINIAFEAR